MLTAQLRKIIIRVVLIIVTLIVIWLIYRKVAAKIKAKKIHDLMQTSYVQTSTSHGLPLTLNLGQVAAQIHDAIWGQFWGDEDEPAAVRAIAGVPKAAIADLNDIYFKIDGHDLRQDFAKYVLDDPQYESQIGYLFA
jgi:hypothetical protein